MRALRVCASDGAEADLCLTEAPGARFGLLWLPALGVSARHYQAFAGALAATGVSVAVHEWRGAGSSNMRASRQCDWGYRELLECDIPASLEAARSALPEVRWIVAGHSIGGQFACLHAASSPSRTSAIAMVASGSPYLETFPSRRRWLMRLIPLAVHMLTAVCGYYPGKRVGFAGTEARTLMRDWVRSARTGLYASYSGEIEIEKRMGEYAKPFLSIQLEDDSLCPPESRDWLLGKFGNASIERIGLQAGDFDNQLATHFSWMKEPAPVASQIANWIERRIEPDIDSPAVSAA
ncbi:alpha/beta fold hydrolase [Dokdonella sp.]|uniref:alpha/beta hydrolase family protein n=1 Tax=Dokdonella sp. TaxID=2291710 RepID=UPI003C54122E